MGMDISHHQKRLDLSWVAISFPFSVRLDRAATHRDLGEAVGRGLGGSLPEPAARPWWENTGEFMMVNANNGDKLRKSWDIFWEMIG